MAVATRIETALKLDDIRALHLEIGRAVNCLRASELQLAELLAAMERGHAYREFAASMQEYCDSIHGLEWGKGSALVRIGRALPALPRLRAAMDTAEVTWRR